MNNEPVAWMLLRDEVCVELTEWFGDMRGWEDFLGDNEKIIPLYTHPVNPKYDPETGEPLIDGYPLFSGLSHPVKELNDGGEPVKNATYWKRQHDNLLMKLNTCAVKLSELEKKLDTRTRELISASFYEHDYKTLMAKPPLTDKEIEEVAVINLGHSMGLLNWMGFARAILRKAQEK
jgi:hypothetical protein